MANISTSNYHIIKDFALGHDRKELQGMKMQALYKLIQKIGEPVKTQYDGLNGVKALEISPGEFVAIKRTAVKQNSFYPCIMKTYLLTAI